MTRHERKGMRDGAVISGVMHFVALALALLGPGLFSDRAARPFNVTNVELVTGQEFDAQLSTAPIVPNEGPAEMSPEAPPKTEPVDVAAPDATLDSPAVPLLAETETPPEDRPDLSELLIPPPPTVVPTEAPRPSIALVPSPDPVRRQAETPESRPSTEVLPELARDPSPAPAARPSTQPSVVTEAAPKPAAAETAPPEPQVSQAQLPDQRPETDPLQPLASNPAPDPAPQPPPPPEPEPAVAKGPEPDAAETAQPNAPEAAAPQQARLPVARPADLAAAAQASSAPEKPKPAAPKPEPAEAPKPSTAPGGSTSQFASIVTRAEKDALRLGIKNYFTYNGNRADKSLQVTVAVELDRQGKIVGGPRLLNAAGGDEGSRNALFQSGRRALYAAQNAGVFAKLPPDKYDGWKLIHVTFTPDERIDFST